MRRYEQELVRLKELREKEKAHFINNIELSKAQAREAYKERMTNQKVNQNYVTMQMDWRAQKTAEERHVDKQYYKPHFGPEETQEIIHNMHQTEREKVNWQYNAIQEQLQEQAEEAEQRRDDERANDIAYLQDTAQIQQAENLKR